MMKFSVIIPTYNRKFFLIKCLESLRVQTYKNFEVIIVDDGSTDSTNLIIDDFPDLHIKYKKIDNSGGPARPRNVALTLAEGEWICYLDVDDFWLENKLEICSNYVSDNIDLLFHDMYIQNSNSETIGVYKGRKLPKQSLTFNLLTKYNPICNSSVVIRKSIVLKSNGFNENEDLRFIEDFDLWLRISFLTNKFYYLNKILGVYLVHENNNSNDILLQCKKIKNLYLNYLQFFNFFKRRKITASMNYYLGSQYHGHFNVKTVFDFYLKSLVSGILLIKAKSIYKIFLLFFKK